MLGPEAAARTPQRYFLQPLVGSGVRVMSSSPATGYSFVGTVTQQAVATPDMDHPSFAAFMRHRKQLAKEVEAKKKVTKLAGDGEMHSSLTTILRSNPTPEQLANMRTLIPGETRMYAPPPMRANNIFEMFERSAYWTMRDIVACTGGREVRKSSCR
ncbi:hypothetical protein EON65_12845 [archaeon]|nr:MAG: hypothetical protein EON65_12845 [archaeon]